jgi:AhpD family alkylhydroperoxidase
MSARINYMNNPLFRKYLEFSMALQDSTIGELARELVSLRASQINGCAFCVDMHVKKATLLGERPLRLHHVAIWRESGLFTPRERAAFAWTELLTTLPPHGVPDAAFAQVREHFSEQELTDLTFAIMAINGWNRISIAYAAVPGSQDKAYGLLGANLE